MRAIQLCTKHISVNSSDLLRLDAQLCFLLYAATRAVTQAYVPLLAPLGLTYPQYLVMLVLWEEDGVPLGRIGERLQLDSGTLTPLIKRMEAAGLVVRERSREDERVLNVSLTEAGRRLRARAAGVPQCRCSARPACPAAQPTASPPTCAGCSRRWRAPTAPATTGPAGAASATRIFTSKVTTTTTTDKDKEPTT